jgi:hypothetical protein
MLGGTLRVTAIPAAVGPQAYAIDGVGDGTWQVGALLDRDDDGVIDGDDQVTFEGGNETLVTVAGADVVAPDLDLPAVDALASVVTDHALDSLEAFRLGFTVARKLRRPVRVSLRAGGEVTSVRDLPLAGSGDGGFRGQVELGSTVPTVGATYLLDVTYLDGTTDTLIATVSGVLLDAPTPLAPIGSSAGDPDPLAPAFSWTAPDPAPVDPYTYRLYLYQPPSGFVWEVRNLPATTLAVDYDFDGTAQQAPLAAGTGYEWELQVIDADGNRASRRATFTTP